MGLEYTLRKSNAGKISLFLFQTRISNFSCIHLHTGDWHVGYKRAFDLFPKSLQKRILAERRKRLDEQQRVALTKATAELNAIADKYMSKAGAASTQ